MNPNRYKIKKPLLSFVATLLVASLHILSNSETNNEVKGGSMTTQSWFKIKNCSELEVIQYKSISDRNIKSQLTIKDGSAIVSLMESIEKIPVEGEMMISFGPKAENIDLVFKCGKETERIEIYEKKFKTPSTGFNTSANHLELAVYNTIETLLHPKINKNILKVKDLEIKFLRPTIFSITYQGNVIHSPSPSDKSPESGEKYLIKGPKNQTEVLIIPTLSKKSMSFKINRKAFTLHEMSADKESKKGESYFSITSI
ncbi:MAG: hypothetical protein K1X29_10720 [Bdellovibrionales bacterium]|nr:hypothetical protein [Bdellovibrionales bacterium]